MIRAPKYFAHEDRVERHDPAVGEAEQQGELVEARELPGEEIEADRHRLERQPGQEHALRADPVGENPQTILPLSEPTPARLNTVAAAIAPTPWSMALATMWKMGPECAAHRRRR